MPSKTFQFIYMGETYDDTSCHLFNVGNCLTSAIAFRGNENLVAQKQIINMNPLDHDTNNVIFVPATFSFVDNFFMVMLWG